MYANFFKRILDFFCALSAILCLSPLGSVCARTIPAYPVFSANPSASFVNGNVYLQQGIPLLLEYHRLTTGNAKQRFAYPQRNYDYRTTTQRFSTAIDKLQLGADANLNAGLFTLFADNDRTIPGMFVGFSASGFIDSLDFDLNAAFFAENRTKHPAQSRSRNDFSTFDRQETDWALWDNRNRDFFNYTRWQGHVGFNYAWLRLEMGRDALHWGPGFYNNLTLNRQAVPYGYFSVDLVFGPLRVISFYSKLEIDSVGSKIHSDGRRHLYGHRYELALGNATFGMSEIQVIYNDNNPWLLVPVYPLFMEKGNYTEHSNNGALAFDANYRIMRTARIYGEFYIDDFDSPMTIIKNDYLNSEWAWLIGVQIGRDFNYRNNKIEVGSIFELAHLEQLVYTHYEANQGQLANSGFPLGNQAGPNSRSIDWTIYGRINEHLFISVRNSWIWKSNVFGSFLNESMISGMSKIRKDYLGNSKFHYELTPMLAFSLDCVTIQGSITLFYEKSLNFSVEVHC